ncbi:phage major capsid protein [Campylobacter mucosalis]|uniref:Phage capsid protein n=1 Tax=Campylobacter mucosalis CCUG 21559 TaxID=1032067 RepID=A0A6G5QFJ7_9BACT|nr:phage major capsid protein [Campylobacter mucosalis]QCD44448.1 phage capsid protein [Campylobacter mucosalis CCUG 21559]
MQIDKLKNEVFKFNAKLSEQNAINETDLTISFLALSRDNLHKRHSFFSDDYYLSVDLESVKFNAKTFYLDHDVSFKNAIGKIEAVKLDEQGFKVIVKFSDEVEESKEAFNRYKAGFSDSVSVGFSQYELIELENIEGVSHYQIINGVINELSAVWQGADKNAKVAKFSKELPKETPKEQTAIKEPPKDEIKDIIELGKILNKPNEALNAIQSGMSYLQFSKSLALQQKSNETIKEFNIMKQPTQTEQNFSLSKIILNAGNITADLGYERENYFNANNGRFVLPSDFAARFSDSITTTTTAKGAIATDFRDDLLIQDVRSESPLLSSCKWLTGLSSKVEIPRNNSNITADFVEEGQAQNAQSLTFDKIMLEPHTLLSTIRITRTMMNMSAFSLEAFAYNAMKFAIRKKLEETILYGKGVIKGIFEVSGVPSIEGYLTAPALDKTLKFADMLDENNANLSNAKFAFKNSDVSKLKATPRGVSTEKMLIETNGDLQGYPYFTTQLIKSGDVAFGDFSDIFIGSFGAIELLTHNERGGDVILELYMDVDAKLGREKSFVISKTSI